MKGRKIKPGAKIMGGEEVVETEAEIATRMGRENKEAAQRLRNKKMTDVEEAIDNASPGFAGDRKYDAQLVADDLAEKRFGKEFYDLDQRQQMDLYDEALEGLSEQTRGMPDPDDFAQGGRAGFMAGGMGRRAFLKMMAAGGAGIAGLKSGLINIFKPRSQAVQEVVETVAKSDATGMPEHFMPLVNKIMNEGKLVKESDRIQTYKHPTRKDIDLEYELDSGSVGVRFDTDQGMPADYYLKKGVPDEMNPRGTGDEFIEGEMKYRMGDGDTYYKNFEEGIESGTSNLDEFVGIKKNVKQDFASGGLAHMLGE